MGINEATYYAATDTGAYLGAYVGEHEPPAGSTPVPFPPGDARMVWHDGRWVEVIDRADLLTRNNAAYEAATSALTADYPQLEKDTWPTQNAEAEAWVADPVGAATPWIDRAATERGLDREEYIRRTLIKARQFVIMSSFLTGRRQKYEDEIKAGGSPELDFTLTPSVLAELQQVAQTITITPAADMQEALA